MLKMAVFRPLYFYCSFAARNFAEPIGKSVPLAWKYLETNGYNECNATVNPVYSMIFAAISYSNTKSV